MTQKQTLAYYLPLKILGFTQRSDSLHMTYYKNMVYLFLGNYILDSLNISFYKAEPVYKNSVFFHTQ
jgi:hypothetical protein